MKLVLKEMKQKIDTFRYSYCILNKNKEQFSAESPWHDVVDADTTRQITMSNISSLFISHCYHTNSYEGFLFKAWVGQTTDFIVPPVDRITAFLIICLPDSFGFIFLNPHHT